MAGVKASLARGFAAIIGIAAMAALSCTDPGAFLKAVNGEAKASLEMYLEVTGVSPAKDAASVNPSSDIKIDFDRALDESTITAQNISVVQAGLAAVGWSYVYDAALKRLSLKPAGLEGGSEYVVTLGGGLHSAKGEPLRDAVAWSFSTANVPGGSIWINVTNPIKPVPQGEEIVAATYTRFRDVHLYIKGNALVAQYYASENPDDLDEIMETPSDWTDIDFTLSDQQGEHTVWALLANTDSSLLSTPISDTIIYDSIAPNAPTAPAISSTTTHAPTWTWSSGGGEGNGTYGYRLITFPGGSLIDSGTLTEASYTSTGIADGGYRLYVSEYDDAGNESPESYSSAAIIDAPPNPPTVSATSPTLSADVTWTWASGGYGNGNYHYVLDPGSMFVWSDPAPDTSYTDSLTDGTHVLNVQERDAGGEWSSSGSSSVVVTPCIPYNGQTNVRTDPTFSWRSAGAESYALQFYNGKEGWTTFATTSGTTWKYRSTLSTSTTYKWRVMHGFGKFTTYIPSETGASFTTTRFQRLGP